MTIWRESVRIHKNRIGKFIALSYNGFTQNIHAVRRIHFYLFGFSWVYRIVSVGMKGLKSVLIYLAVSCYSLLSNCFYNQSSLQSHSLCDCLKEIRESGLPMLRKIIRQNYLVIGFLDNV